MIYRVVASAPFAGPLNLAIALELQFRCFDLHAENQADALQRVQDELGALEQGEARAIVCKLLAPDALVYQLEHGRPLPYPAGVELGEDGDGGPSSPMDIAGLL